MRKTTSTTTATDVDLQRKAAAGDRSAFDALHERHASRAWRLALAVAGDPDLAARAVVDATGTLFTSLRAGRFHALPHGSALAAGARNAALDLRRNGASTSTPLAAGADAMLASSFHSLPERWRSVLWLRDVEALDAAEVAPVVELTEEAVDQVAVRARRGLRERYLRALVAGASGRACTRAGSRLGALDEGTLNDKDVATLERHLAHCESCADRRRRLARTSASLAALGLAAPDDLADRSATAWTSALASSTHTGLSPRTEKVLAGASAFAAGLGVLGAALFGAGGGSEPTASPLAPLVADIETPRPVDLSDLLAPITSPTPPSRPTVSAADFAASRAGTTTGGTTTGGTTTGTEIAAPAAPTAPGSDIGTPAAEAPSSPVGDVPISIDVEEGITVGPVTLDPTPGADDPVLDIDVPQLAPVIDPVEEVVNEVTTPVVEAVEPVVTATEPVIDAVQPVTDAITAVAGSLGL
ncbi:MAG TPA: hypothetical protein VFV42_05795 [Acidimicrobiales bacterium]|nr:hypothetical protein [Acidimicrobiales bacterium]